VFLWGKCKIQTLMCKFQDHSYVLMCLHAYGFYWIGIPLVLWLSVASKGFAQMPTNLQENTSVVEKYFFDPANGKDTISTLYLPEVFVFPDWVFKNEKEKQEYTKLVRDVKRTLPYAKLIYNTIIETYEYIETMPNDKTRNTHLKRMEKELYNQYKPEMKKLTLTQGKLLIKLIDRECNQTSYNIVSAYMGKLRASFWNVFAGMFGASLKTKYDPNGKDALTERVVLLVEHNQI